MTASEKRKQTATRCRLVRDTALNLQSQGVRYPSRGLLVASVSKLTGLTRTVVGSMLTHLVGNCGLRLTANYATTKWERVSDKELSASLATDMQRDTESSLPASESEALERKQHAGIRKRIASTQPRTFTSGDKPEIIYKSVSTGFGAKERKTIALRRTQRKKLYGKSFKLMPEGLVKAKAKRPVKLGRDIGMLRDRLTNLDSE